MPAIPEGHLRDAVAVSAQRQRIAAVRDGVRQALAGVHHRVVRQFTTIPLMAIEASPDALRVLESLPGAVLRVSEDAIKVAHLAQSGPLVGAPTAWRAGVDGAGRVIAVLDTGVDKQHPFLAGRIVEEACYSSTVPGRSATLCPNGQDEQVGAGAGVPCADDGCDHGTHVAGIAAGNGSDAGQSFSGVARGARIMAVQVFSRLTTSADCGGPPPCTATLESDLIAAMERVYSLREVYPFSAVNMSLGGGAFTANCDQDPLKPIIDTLRSVGIATTVSSGNDGFTNAIGSPACISTAISVGSTTKTDGVAVFSNVAAFLSLFAPGSSITSSIPGGGFAVFSGTSTSAPHAAGAFALLQQVVSGVTVSQGLHALQLTGQPITDVTGITRPRLRVDAALSYLGVGPLTPFAVTEPNLVSFSSGQTLTLHLTAGNPSSAPGMDLYVGALFPDGNTIAFLTAPNVFAGLGQLRAPASVAPFTTAGPGFSVSGLPVLAFTFPASGIPVGTYSVFAALFRQGSLADNAISDGDLVWLDTVDIAYAP